MVYEKPGGFARISSFVADKHEFWWNERKPDQPMLWESKIELSEKFFNEIIHHPVPLDMNTLKAVRPLKISPMGSKLSRRLRSMAYSAHACQDLKLCPPSKSPGLSA